MTDLRNATEADLQVELERRKQAAALGPIHPLPSPDFSDLQKTVVDGTAQSIKDGYENDDFNHYIYEAAMEAVYGKAYWTWKRQQGWAS